MTVSQNGTTGSLIRRSWITLRVGDPNAEPHAKGAGHEQGTIYGVGCPCGHDRRCGGRTGWRRAVAGDHSESPGIDPEAGEEARACRIVAGLLRSRSDRVCDLLAADEPRGACEVVAPTLVPVKAGDRVKTDRRD